jgi:hypothetical protein
LQNRRDKVARQALRDKAFLGDLWRFNRAVGQTVSATCGALSRLHFPLEASLSSARWCVAKVKWGSL